MIDTTAAADIRTAVIYSLIAFSIVFIVLGGLTLVIYAMRFATGSETPGGGTSSSSGDAKPKPAAAAAPAEPAKIVSAPAANAMTHHVAAITAAILAITQGRGRIKSVTPAQGPGETQQSAPGGTTQRWRAAAILENSSRRLQPAWKR